MNRRARITVTGRVQGVSFRAYAQREAENRALRGWVRNRPDRSVEIVAEGDADGVQRFVDWAQRGPALARVEDVQVAYEDPTGEFDGFEIVD